MTNRVQLAENKTVKIHRFRGMQGWKKENSRPDCTYMFYLYLLVDFEQGEFARCVRFEKDGFRVAGQVTARIAIAVCSDGRVVKATMCVESEDDGLSDYRALTPLQGPPCNRMQTSTTTQSGAGDISPNTRSPEPRFRQIMSH